MNFKEFMSELDKDIKNVYLLSGEENFFIDKACEKILSRLKVDKTSELLTIDCDTKPALSDIINAIDSSPLFSSRNIVLVKNATIFNSEKTSERLENILRDMQPMNYVIFTTKAADKRRKLYKIIAKVGAILETKPLRAWEIDDWLNGKLNELGKIMRGEARRYFNERIGILPEISLWYLENELDKIALNVSGKEITATDLRRNMLIPPEVSNFALTEAIDERKSPKAIYLLRAQAKSSAKFPLIIILLVNHVRQLLRVKFFISQGIVLQKLGDSLGMNPYIARKLGEISKSYQEKFLEDILIELSDADFRLKTGRVGIEILERIILKMCSR